MKCICILALVIAKISALTHDKQQIRRKIDQTPITYGSTIRIKAVSFNYYLHSHEVNYPLGSGSQSVTGFPADNDYNSLWTIKQAHGDHVKTYEEAVKCGDTIRLEHALTKRNLHSEEIYQSMVTKNQEVSAYGSLGYGDENDNWILKCSSKGEDTPFTGADVFELIHENTEQKLKMSKYYQYTYQNWDNCPFQGQIQVSACQKSTKETEFKIVGGVFFRESAQQETQTDDEDL